MDTLILCLGLLTASPDQDLPATSVYWQHQPLIRQLALRLEILDERENTILFYDTSAPADLEMLRRRYQELKDVPLAYDTYRFPSFENAEELKTFNRAYHWHAIGYRDLTVGQRYWGWTTIIHENNYLHSVWDSVADAQRPYFTIVNRRLALKCLRELIGEEAYYAGRLPPYVPVWRFQELE